MTSDLEKCKKYLRSILLASKGGVPGVQLVSKYRENTGDSIPYRSFGFSSLETFLQSIPEVCRIVTRGREVMVEGVATKETKHIKELVQNQEENKAARRDMEQKLSAAKKQNTQIDANNNNAGQAG